MRQQQSLPFGFALPAVTISAFKAGWNTAGSTETQTRTSDRGGQKNGIKYGPRIERRKQFLLLPPWLSANIYQPTDQGSV